MNPIGEQTTELPKTWTYQDVRTWCLDLDSHLHAQKLIFDFSNVSFTHPVGMMIVGSALRRIVVIRHKAGLNTTYSGISTTIKAHTYLEHLGFFDFVYLKDRTKIGSASGSERYIPIRKISRSEFETQGKSSKEVTEEIDQYSKSIAEVFSSGIDDHQAQRVIAYAFREIIRNVFEHSGANHCYIAGQRWGPTRVEVVVLDEGRGIRGSLSEAHSVDNDADALRMAIKPGVSRTSGTTVNEHDNSGFGLYVLSEVGRQFGRFVVGSGDSALRVENTVQHEDFAFSGTVVGLNLSKSPNNFGVVLADIIKKGEAETKSRGDSKTASPMSKRA